MRALYPGVRVIDGQVRSSEELARRAADLAERASHRGTFGIGGVAVTRSGQLLAEAENAVIRGGQVVDPTAHVERQLVDWLLNEGRYRISVPLDEIVIVSSLDPCAMCAGAILRAGLNVVSIAGDPLSGVHGSPSDLLRIPRSLHRRAEREFAAFGIEGGPPTVGMDFGELFTMPISQQVHRRARDAFSASVARVRNIIGGSWGEVNREKAKLGGQSYEKLLKSYLHDIPRYWYLSDDAFCSNIKREWPHRLSCVLEDHTAKIVIGVADGPDLSPTESGVIRLIRAYCALRNTVPETVRAELPHPRSCSIVVKRFPDADDQALFELGAIGSFMEEERMSGARAALLYLDADDDRRPQAILRSLPPLYTRVIGLRVEPLRD